MIILWWYNNKTDLSYCQRSNTKTNNEHKKRNCYYYFNETNCILLLPLQFLIHIFSDRFLHISTKYLRNIRNREMVFCSPIQTTYIYLIFTAHSFFNRLHDWHRRENSVQLFLLLCSINKISVGVGFGMRYVRKYSKIKQLRY